MQMKMEKKIQFVGTPPKSNLKIIETEVKYIPLTHMYVTGYSPGWIQALQ